jgi:Cdc6-like AAA superfamily ATPase
MSNEDILTTIVLLLLLVWGVLKVYPPIFTLLSFFNSLIPTTPTNKLPKWYGYHLIIYGGTGSGKSTYIEYALYKIKKSSQTAQFIIINPHHRRGQWGLENVIGGGRNYEEIPNEINNIINLMNKRYQEYYENINATFNDVFVVIDELPAIITNTNKTVSNNLKQLSSEARKVNIWLIILSQSVLVKQLGFERASDMLDNFVFVSVAKPKALYTIEDVPVEEIFTVQKVNLNEKN